MSNNNKLIPKLRFPEFMNDGEWKDDIIENIIISESSSVALNKLELKKEGYVVYGADSIVGYIDNYQHENEYISIVKDGSGVGRLNFCESKSSVLGTLTSLKSKDNKKYNLNWIYYLLNTIDFSSYIKGSGIPHIYFSDYKKENIFIPKLSDQQKIASCLSSLDELITAHTNKLATLKTYKKGLMQNLFPQEGEKVPKFRFKEFENDGVWKETTLGKIGKFSKGKGISKNDIEHNGNFECIRYGELYTTYGEIVDQVVSKTNLDKNELNFSEANDVILPSSGETQIDIAKASCIIRKNIAIGGDINIFKSTLNGVFLSYYLNSAKKMEIAKLSQGISVVHLYSSQLENLIINYPISHDNNPKEQQKIASTLSSLDELINEQTNKIAQLKLHKKGLMQGLFPKVKN